MKAKMLNAMKIKLLNKTDIRQNMILNQP